MQELLDEVENLERKIKGMVNMGNGKLRTSKIREVRAAVVGEAVDFDASQWSKLSADKQKKLLKRLTALRNELLDISGAEDWRQPSYLPPGEDGSKQSIIWLAIFGFIFAATLLSLIR
jgi:hypothetical protein